MREHSEDFLPFLTNKDGYMMSNEDFESYLRELEGSAVWGGQPEVKFLFCYYSFWLYFAYSDVDVPNIYLHYSSLLILLVHVHNKRAPWSHIYSCVGS